MAPAHGGRAWPCPSFNSDTLLADKVDINFQFMTVTDNRALQVEFTIPYYREGVTLLFPADSPYNTRADLAGKGANIAILQNVTAEDMVHRGVADAKVQQFDSVAASIEALDSGRVDATAVDLSSGQWLVAQNPGKYKFDPNAWDPQTYAASVKPGDQIWLNYVNSVLHEAMVGLNFPLYQQAFKTYFSVDLPVPPLGFPVEFK
jgi:polar amino acid transport system substrate-binding protein